MKILFQGDSITDALRNYDDHTDFGRGYALLVAAELGYENPDYEFVNKGISGNRIVDVYARIKSDIINLKPDVMSILIGVNDIWSECERQDGVDTEKFYKIYDMLIAEVKEALPNIKIMIMEPCALKGFGNESYWEHFSAEVKKRAEMAKKIAEKYNLPFIPLQEGFDELAKKADASHWLVDGVHPTPFGHEFMKRQWLKAFKTL